jgi:iron complex transport system substrate-binding protein
MPVRASGNVWFGLLLSVVAAAGTWVAHSAPGDLLPAPERPYQGYGNPAVRTELNRYPRRATGADDVQVQIDRPARRIVSQGSHSDEYLYSVVPPESVVGVSETAYEPRLSNVYAHVQRHTPIVASDPERVLLANPDLVFTPQSARADIPNLLRRAGVPVYRIYTMFETLASIEDHIRLTGYLTGDDERAEREVRRFRNAIDRAAGRRPRHMRSPRVLGLGGTYSYGTKTLFTDILRTLGAQNVAAAHGLVGYDRATDEQIVRWDPEWIVTGADRDSIARARARLLTAPALAATSAGRSGRIVVLDNRVFLPLSPFTSQLVEALADALYGGGQP